MKFLLSLLLLILFFTILLRLFENKFVFFPSKYPEGFWEPQSMGLQTEECFFTTSDSVKLHGWFLPNKNAVATLLWCPGNAGNISDRLHNLGLLAELPLNIFIFDYRGYGKSEGSTTEEGIYLDAQAAYDYLTSRKDINKQKIVIFGRSLGGAVAVDLATRRECAALILESTFTSAKDMARSSFGFLPVHYIIKTKLNSIAKISEIQVPLLMIHGNSDRTVPFKLGKKLFAAANPPKEFYEIDGATHNDTYIVGGQPYFNKILEFIQQLK